MNALAAATDALFADPNIARDAVWHGGGAGTGTAIRVIARRPNQVVGFGDSRAILPTMLVDVRRSEVATPACGDTVEMDGEIFELIATPTLDSLRLVWVCEAAPLA